jgi:hypothetical protein
LEKEQELFFYEEIDVNRKCNRKRDLGGMVFDEVVKAINLTENDKKFLETK